MSHQCSTCLTGGARFATREINIIVPTVNIYQLIFVFALCQGNLPRIAYLPQCILGAAVRYQPDVGAVGDEGVSKDQLSSSNSDQRSQTQSGRKAAC